jgi:hypothetical protein
MSSSSVDEMTIAPVGSGSLNEGFVVSSSSSSWSAASASTATSADSLTSEATATGAVSSSASTSTSSASSPSSTSSSSSSGISAFAALAFDAFAGAAFAAVRLAAAGFFGASSAGASASVSFAARDRGFVVLEVTFRLSPTGVVHAPRSFRTLVRPLSSPEPLEETSRTAMTMGQIIYCLTLATLARAEDTLSRTSGSRRTFPSGAFVLVARRTAGQEPLQLGRELVGARQVAGVDDRGREGRPGHVCVVAIFQPPQHP